MDALTKQFESARENFVSFTADLESILRKLLEHAGIELAALEARTKGVDSFRGKVDRPEKKQKYKKCEDVTDLSGLRLVCYLHEEAQRVSKLLADHFTIDIKNSKYRHEFLAADRLGYRADHIVISLSPERLKLPELSKYKNYKAEIQVKTVLEHAWAAVDWKIRYKGQTGIPEPVLRRLYRISALLEGADEDFSRVKAETGSIRNAYSKKIKSGNLAIALDRESAIAFLKQSVTANKIAASARRLGFRVRAAQTLNTHPMDGFLGTMELLKITDIDNLERRLALKVRSSEAVLRKFRGLVKAGEPMGSERFDVISRVTLVRIFLLATSSKEDAKKVLENIPFTKKVSDAIMTLLGGEIRE
ncbi:GTP pyrophosphokinase [Pararoseomonas indoligenes]|uniref:RelA/SpoT domain-containing protein n=1 Tax=Roseomonas indoligenes TaxID=2820811 RepID=A0A940S508_9PROT|nr:hypothetical protein [Pararoseomonas indoligenes]